ncbi:MAG: hypothetical protein IJK52_11015 [Oscillospiraceae bacterium]|nr:hypothetical protein [Oscillospiraceae bacterium]
MEITNCPMCGKHCPIEASSCERGQTLAAKLENGETIDLNSMRGKRGGRERGRRHDGGHRRDNGT